MNDRLASPTSYETSLTASPVAPVLATTPRPVEFSGASHETIAEAVRQALDRASRSLRTLDGVGVLVIPHIHPEGSAPRYRVTLQITGSDAGHVPPSRPPL